MNYYYTYKIDLSPSLRNFLICFYPGFGLDFDRLSTEIAAHYKDAFVSKNLIFITPSFAYNQIKDIANDNDKLKKLQETINSNQELNVQIISIDRSGSRKVENFGNSKKLTLSQIDLTIDIGISRIIKTNNVIIESKPHYHFAKPSKKHSNKFIMSSNAFRSHSETIFFALIALSFVKNDFTKIFIDTPGIYQVAFELIRLNCLFQKSTFTDIAIDTFGSYEKFNEYEFESDSLILISASTSNNLENLLVQDKKVDRSTIISLISSNSNSLNCVAKLENLKHKTGDDYFSKIASFNEDECPLCLNNHSVPIHLNSDHFSFEPPRTEKYLLKSIDSNKQLRSLISHYKKYNVFKCLFDGLDGSKYPTPEYFIDIKKLIKNCDHFKKKVYKKIERELPLYTSHIIHCDDSGAKELAQLINNHVKSLGTTLEIIPAKDINDDIKNSKGITVVAGSIQSGNALLNISRSLRNHRNSPITYIVGFAKYNSYIQLEKLKNDLIFFDGEHGQHQFHCIEKIILPIQEDRTHSWDKEIKLLNKLRETNKNSTDVLSEINKRDNHLKISRSVEKMGLGERLFIDSPSQKHLELGANFAFWNKEDSDVSFKNQGTIYFTISSILQTLRTEKNKSGIAPLGKGYIIRQLDPLIFDRFNEGVIQASFLRAARPSELNYSSDNYASEIILSLLLRMIEHPEQKESEALPEFLLALCLNKLQIEKKLLRELTNKKPEKSKYPYLWALYNHLESTNFGNIEEDIPF
ncbi:hypothetical protein ABMA57_17360 [Saccharospirillum sp. HFRX-1]|uniref:hypothetical protein n=1 Tax=unclassified Saccharospirillum TaxID=2633430 RepID=UPI00371CC335